MATSVSPACVLIVEDEFLIRLTLSEALADEGYVVVEAATGEEALEMLRADPAAISLVLTDIQLGPAMNGRELVAQIRQMVPNLPVIFMTGRPEAMADLLTARDRFVAKPYLPSEICAVARDLLRS